MPCTMLKGMKYELLNVDFFKCFKLIHFLIIFLYSLGYLQTQEPPVSASQGLG